MGGGQATEGLQALRSEALAAVRGYAEESLAVTPFVRGETTVPVAGQVIGAPELEALVDASLDGWLTEGRFAQRFAPAFAQRRRATTRLLSRLGLPGQPAGRRRRTALTSTSGRCAPATRSITPALGFSTTVNPIYQHGLVPVYVDVELDTLQSDARGDRRRHRRPHPRRHGRSLPGQPIRRRAPGRAVRRARPRADRGLLRRARDHARRPRGRHLRRGGHLLVLSGPSHDHRRGRRRRGRRRHLGAGARVAARMGPRLLVPARRERRLRPALRRPASESCPRATTTSTSSRTWASTSRSPTCRPPWASRSSSASTAFRRAPAHNFARLDAALGELDERMVLPAHDRRSADPSWFGYPFTLREGGPPRAPRAPALPARAPDRLAA